ncbi:AHH domain-containing protein [Archangium sp.]|uniref:AHH domain-containing protein n=1 Tax=Archangium sp. TaxID=1872627 RepID=UPI002D273A55|nr:AHH domain-containing protein [Archangium sp.]HYO58312.1 AHH domain-containing protein [Archangium sp.]
MNIAQAVKQLHDEAEAARNIEELQAASKNFGQKMGGVALRVFVTIAIGRLAGKLPEVPKAPGGGLWSRLGAPRYTLAKSVTLEGAPVVQTVGARATVVLGEAATAETSVANGTVLLMGALTGSEASAATAAIKAARTTGGCREDNSKGDAPAHHIATNKNDIAEVRGGPWTPRFEELFELAGLSLEDPANIIHVINHKGPHPEEYHTEVYRRLRQAFGNCRTPDECQPKLRDALDKVAGEICTQGTQLNKLVTKEP